MTISDQIGIIGIIVGIAGVIVTIICTFISVVQAVKAIKAKDEAQSYAKDIKEKYDNYSNTEFRTKINAVLTNLKGLREKVRRRGADNIKQGKLNPLGESYNLATEIKTTRLYNSERQNIDKIIKFSNTDGEIDTEFVSTIINGYADIARHIEEGIKRE